MGSETDSPPNGPIQRLPVSGNETGGGYAHVFSPVLPSSAEPGGCDRDRPARRV